MGKEVEWRKMDEYYWLGPPGWTICRVWIGDGYKFELWQASRELPIGHFETFDEAAAQYEKMQ